MQIRPLFFITNILNNMLFFSIEIKIRHCFIYGLSKFIKNIHHLFNPARFKKLYTIYLIRRDLKNY